MRPTRATIGSLHVPLVVSLMVLAGGAPAAAQSPGDSEPFSLALTHLELNLDLDFEDGSLAGWVHMEVSNQGDAPVRVLPFNLGRLMTVDRVSIVGPSTGGGAAEFTQGVSVFTDSPKRQVNQLAVRLPRPLPPGQTITLRVDYGGYLVGYTETGSVYIQDRVDEAFSILREDAFAWPVLGTLSRRVNRSAPRPDFDFRARVTVPEGHTVASSGRLVAQTVQDGRAKFVYESNGPVPFLNLPIARYGLLEAGGVRVYHFPQDSAGARRVLESATRGLALLETWFGPLDTEPELAVMEIPEMWGSQASLTAGIIQTADAFRDAGHMSQLYHELTHIWNAPDVDLPSARWNEGLATFLSGRMAAELDGWDGMEGDVGRTAERILRLAESNPTVADVPFIEYGQANVTGLSYRVGYLMFFALYRTIGPEAFDQAVGGYYQIHKDRGGTFEALMESCGDASPVDLDDFFRDWVLTTRWLEQLSQGKPVEDIGVR